MAGRELSQMKDCVEMGVPQLQLLVRYYSVTDDATMLKSYARKLANAVDNETKRLTHLTKLAIERKSQIRAEFYLGQIVMLNPDASTLSDLKETISNMGKEDKKTIAAKVEA